MNDEELRKVLQETLRLLRIYGLNSGAVGYLDRSTRGITLASPSRRVMVKDVIDGLREGSTNTLHKALQWMYKVCKTESYAKAYDASPAKIATIDIETSPYVSAWGRDGDPLQHDGTVSRRTSSTQLNLSNLPKTGTNTTMNKTTTELRAELAAAEAAEATKAADDQRAAAVQRYFRLHAATGAVLTDIRDRAITPRGLTAEFRKELSPLAAEFGYRIVLVGDRTTAVLVQA